MISIIKIKSYIPKGRFDIQKNYPIINKKFLKDKIGTLKLSRKKKNEDVVEMCIKAFKKFKIKKINNLKALILCTQNPESNGLPHNSSIIHNKLNLKENIATLDISQGCAGYIYSLKVCENFLLKENDKALIFTCDPYSKIIKNNDLNTEILFGDAATVTLVSKKKRGKLIKDYSFLSNTFNNEAINNRDGFLKMNGNKIMNFANNYVDKEIFKILKKNNILLKNIEKFYFHQGSKHIIKQIIKKIKIDNKKVPIILNNIGNTISSSIPITLEKDNFKKSNSFLLCGFGVGLSVATCIVKKYE